MWNGDGRFDVNLCMGYRMELDQKGLRKIRSWAILEGFGSVQYRIVGAGFRRDEAKIRPPKYQWYFVQGSILDTFNAPIFTLPKPLEQALVDVGASKGSIHLENWGLLRYTRQGIELIPDAGPLADDHPHAGWVPVSISQETAGLGPFAITRRNTKVPSVKAAGGMLRSSPKLLHSLAAGFLWLSLLGGLRVGLMGDGVEPAFTTGWAETKWAKAGWLAEWAELRSFYVPLILRPAASIQGKANGLVGNNSPLEMGEDPSAWKAWPIRLIVLGLYSRHEGAEQWRESYEAQGYEAMIFERRVPGKGLLFAVALPYRGYEPVQFLKHIRKHLLLDAWLLPEKDSFPLDPGLSPEGLSL